MGSREVAGREKQKEGGRVGRGGAGAAGEWVEVWGGDGEDGVGRRAGRVMRRGGWRRMVAAIMGRAGAAREEGGAAGRR